ncbi:PGR5-like protein, partial [Trifolium pratense]
MNMLPSTSGTTTTTTTALGGWTVLQLSKIRSNRSVSSSSSFSLRISATCDDRPHGPSCIYVGPLQTATQETLEALYSQARDAYYRGEPLIVDDMFDRV